MPSRRIYHRHKSYLSLSSFIQNHWSCREHWKKVLFQLIFLHQTSSNQLHKLSWPGEVAMKGMVCCLCGLKPLLEKNCSYFTWPFLAFGNLHDPFVCKNKCNYYVILTGFKWFHNYNGHFVPHHSSRRKRKRGQKTLVTLNLCAIWHGGPIL